MTRLVNCCRGRWLVTAACIAQSVRHRAVLSGYSRSTFRQSGRESVKPRADLGGISAGPGREEDFK